jgi:anti-sigma B factor antagonist
MTTTTVALERVGSAAIVRIGGDVTSASEAELTAAFGEGLDGGARAVILDFSGMEYMNSGGIGLLVTLLVRAQRAGARLLAAGLSDHYRQILALTRLDEAIEIHPTEAAALATVPA